jgi:hypothetical protein
MTNLDILQVQADLVAEHQAAHKVQAVVVLALAATVAELQVLVLPDKEIMDHLEFTLGIRVAVAVQELPVLQTQPTAAMVYHSIIWEQCYILLVVALVQDTAVMAEQVDLVVAQVVL